MVVAQRTLADISLRKSLFFLARNHPINCVKIDSRLRSNRICVNDIVMIAAEFDLLEGITNCFVSRQGATEIAGKNLRNRIRNHSVAVKVSIGDGCS